MAPYLEEQRQILHLISNKNEKTTPFENMEFGGVELEREYNLNPMFGYRFKVYISIR